jgi:uncharacterized membrane protein/small-conductance mechanosensitive channel
MFGRLLTIVETIRGSLWFWPVILAMGALLLARGTITLDRSGWLDPQEIAWLFGSGTVGARALLATVATAMISIAATVFSVTIVALSLAAGQMGPRLLRTFMRDRGTQASLGMFIATFAFCVTVLGVVDASSPEQFVPRASVTTALVLAFISLAVLIYFIHHVAASIQAPTVIRVVGDELEAAIERLFPENIEDNVEQRASAPTAQSLLDSSGSPSLVPACSSGYLQFIDQNALFEIARKADARIVLVRTSGDFVLAGTALAEVWPGAFNNPEVMADIQGAITCGWMRTPVQDPLYLVKQLVEIAQRALSPGINDPTTAESCIDRLGSALGALLGRRTPASQHMDADGVVRLTVREPDFSSFAAAVFDPIRNYSGGSRQVLLRLAGLLGDLAPLVRNVSQREPLLDQAERLERAAATLNDPEDRAAVEAASRRAIAALQMAPQGTPHSAWAGAVVGGIATSAGRGVAAVALACFLSLAIPAPLHAADDVLSEAASPPEIPASTITVESNADSDREIEQRLRQLYMTVDGLDNVTVDVTAGVVELSGEVTSRAAHEQALMLARRVQSVVEVQDNVDESTDLKSRLIPAADNLLEQVIGLVAWLPLLGVSLLVLFAFWWFARLVACSTPFERLFRHNPFLRDLVRQVVRLLIFAIGVVLSLEILDASRLVTTLLGAAGVVGLALGFALRDTVENYIASLLLSLRQPFARNDHVVIEGCEGRVLRLTPRATILMTLDGNHTRIPNAKVYKAVIVNYTRNPKRRFEFDVGVDTEQNLADAQELAARTLQGMDGVLDDPAPYCTVETLGDSNVILRVYGWVDQQQADFLRVRSEAIRLVKRAYDQAGIVMPEPIYNLKLLSQNAGMARISLADAPAPVSADEPATTCNEPAQAIDIGKQDDLDEQIAADRQGTGGEDLLSASARKE